MHMADALLSPAVGGTFWAGTAATIGYASKRLKQGIDDRKIPLMGVLGAFIFASQMINFTIPGTGSSGHLGGGMILAILLGPHAAFLVMASVLTVQGLFFADGGLLALGCNVWNLGIYPCYVAYPLVYRPLAGDGSSPRRIFAASLVGAVGALQLGALSVALQTHLSGKSELPFGSFLLLMQPIHLAIGIVEGLVTAGVVSFVRALRPEILDASAARGSIPASASLRTVLVGFIALAAVTGGALSWFASAHPDGLEWSIERITGKAELQEREHGVSAALKELQEKTAILPDYGFRTPEAEAGKPEETPSWPSVDAGSTVSGLVGGILVLAMAMLVGWAVRALRRRRAG
ncbi:MAG: energy-coupling factor ABC transporter permease [Thermodesulfobacteriota bacterium]